jgi:small subunit ribosomal protein S3Ae
MVTAARKKGVKNWYNILAPKIFNQAQVGEAAAGSNEELVGRIINTHFSELTGDITKQFIKLKLKVENVQGENALTDIIEYELSKQYLQRMIRRGTSKMEEIIDLNIKDKPVRIKIIMITASKAQSSQKSSLRNALRTEIVKTFKSSDLNNLIITLAAGKLQREILKTIKIVFPVRFLEVRKIEILNPKQVKKMVEPKIIEVIKEPEEIEEEPEAEIKEIKKIVPEELAA